MPSILTLSTFTAPKQRLITEPYTKSLLHFDGVDGSTSFVDETGIAWVGVGNAELDDTQKVFGNTSLYLAGDGSHVKSQSVGAFVLTDTDFTIEARVRFEALPTSGALAFLFYQTEAAGGNIANWLAIENVAGVMTCKWRVRYGGMYRIMLDRVFDFQLDTWYHIEISKIGNDTRMFIDGIQQGAVDTSVYNPKPCGDTPTYLGALYTGSQALQGWMQEFRFSNYARHTSDFGLPPAPYVYSQSIDSDDLVLFKDFGRTFEPVSYPDDNNALTNDLFLRRVLICNAPVAAPAYSVLVIADITQAQVIENATLTAHGLTLVIADIAQVQVTETPALVQHQVLAVADTAQAQAIENVTLTQHHLLSIGSVTQSQAIEGTNLTQHNVLDIDDIDQLQVLENATLTYHPAGGAPAMIDRSVFRGVGRGVDRGVG
jgi:hypothetical protein